MVTTSTRFTWKAIATDKEPVRRLVRERYVRLGLFQERTVTAEELQALMQEKGVRPEDNLASCGISASRDEE
jgi:hypothetical protein